MCRAMNRDAGSNIRDVLWHSGQFGKSNGNINNLRVMEIMPYNIEFTEFTTDITRIGHVGNKSNKGQIVARAHCPFCQSISVFRQIGDGNKTRVAGQMVAMHCEACGGIVSCNIDKSKIYPTPSVRGVEEELPSQINKYYEEGLRCLSANAPNGAATVFRKVIDATCLHYGVSEIENSDSFYNMIEKLAKEGVITESLRKTLLGVKDGGRDGAHVNNQDPTMEQAHNMKRMIDSVLTATVVADKKLGEFREDHPNQFADDS